MTTTRTTIICQSTMLSVCLSVSCQVERCRHYSIGLGLLAGRGLWRHCGNDNGNRFPTNGYQFWYTTVLTTLVVVVSLWVSVYYNTVHMKTALQLILSVTTMFSLPAHFFAILNVFPAFVYSSAASSVLDEPLNTNMVKKLIAMPNATGQGQHAMTNTLHGLRTIRTLDYSYPRLFVPSMDCSYPPGLFVPWTVRTVLGLFVPWTVQQCSYPRLFIPSWTVHTMDYSYRPWTFRTLDDSYLGLFIPALDDSYHVEN